MSFGEGNKHERIRELESRNKALKSENGKLRELVAWLMRCPVPPGVSNAAVERCREIGIEVD
jgi:hypothetical protein